MTKAGLDHNHDLPGSAEDFVPYDVDRLIPSDLEKMADILKGFRPPGEIHMILTRTAKKMRIPVTWTQRDIQNRYGMQNGSGNFWQVDELLKVLPASVWQPDACSTRRRVVSRPGCGPTTG